MNEKEYLDFLEKSYGATVPEKIKNLPNVELELANGSLYPEKGRIEVVTGQIDPATGTIQFRVGFLILLNCSPTETVEPSDFLNFTTIL